MSVASPSTNIYFQATSPSSIDKVWELSKGERVAKSPIKVKRCGKKKVDIVYGLDSYFISDRAFALLEQSGLTGWSTFPVALP